MYTLGVFKLWHLMTNIGHFHLTFLNVVKFFFYIHSNRPMTHQAHVQKVSSSLMSEKFLFLFQLRATEGHSARSGSADDLCRKHPGGRGGTCWGQTGGRTEEDHQVLTECGRCQRRSRARASLKVMSESRNWGNWANVAKRCGFYFLD